MPPPIAALDLGSTRFKAALWVAGQLDVIATAPTPPLTGEGRIREGDALAWLAVSRELLTNIAAAAPGAMVGIASQRSSLVVWRADNGQPVTRLISWQDRRAEAWCRMQTSDLFAADALFARTGLPLSPHYAGPKLASMMSADPGLREGLNRGDLRFGTLETFLLWHWSGGAVYHTDRTMAARTLMVDLASGDWCPQLLAAYGLPACHLPDIGSSAGHHFAIEQGLTVVATVSDQGAGALAVLGEQGRAALVNLGTGGFVLRWQTGEVAPTGYLRGPALARVEGDLYALEGTLNAIGPAVDGTTRTPTGTPPIADPTPDLFCLPDATGIGAPHWRADLSLVFSQQIPAPDDRRRVVLEGILFRVVEILHGLGHDGQPVVLAGGLSVEPFIAAGLARLWSGQVTASMEQEATLSGAAQLASGQPTVAGNVGPVIAPVGGDYLCDKYRRWQTWMQTVLAASAQKRDQHPGGDG